MSKYFRRIGTPVAVAAVAMSALLGACGSDAKNADKALGADSTLNRDLALANRDSAAQPQLKDVPAAAPVTPAPAPAKKPTTTKNTPAPRPSAPAPKPASTTSTTKSGNVVTTNPGAGTNPSAAGGGAVGTIPAGATLNAAAANKICTNTNNVGDHVTATLASAVAGENGAVIPAGADVNLTVTKLKRSENANDPIIMEFAVNSVSFGGKTYPIEGTVESAAVDRIKDQPGSKDAQKVAIGAAAGAIAGRILGKSTKATVIGGAAGAAAGAAAASATANYQGCIPSGGSIVVKLTAPATVRA